MTLRSSRAISLFAVQVAVAASSLGCSSEFAPSGAPASDAGTEADSASEAVASKPDASSPDAKPDAKPAAEAGASDAAEDAWNPGVLLHTVTIETVGTLPGGAPLPILVSNPDGSIYKLTSTNLQGQLQVNAPDQGFVSAFIERNLTMSGTLFTMRRIHTLGRVANGNDVLRVDAGDDDIQDPKPAGKLTFVPVGTLPAGTFQVRVQLPCGNGWASPQVWKPTEPIVVSNYQSCAGATEAYAIAYAVDSFGQAVAAAFVPHIPIEAAPKTINLVFDGSTTFVNQAIMFVEPPNASYGRAQITTLEEGYGPNAWTAVSSVQAPVSYPFSIPVATNFFTQYQISTTADLDPIGGGIERWSDYAERRIGAYGSDDMVYFHPLLAPPITSLSKPDFTNLARPKVSWAVDQALPLPDCTEAYMAWSSSTTDSTMWFIGETAAGAGTLQPPELPPSLAQYAPKNGDTFAGVTMSRLIQDHEVKCGDFVTVPEKRHSTSAQWLP